MAAPRPIKLGPGHLSLGETGTEMDASCLLTAAGVSWDKDEADPIRVLCGDSVSGGVTYSATLAGTVLQDLDDEDGLVAYSWANRGVTVPFTYTPNDEAKATVTGQVTIDPLSVGDDGADYGDTLTSEFSWACVGEPDLSWPATGGVQAEAVSDTVDPGTAQVSASGAAA